MCQEIHNTVIWNNKFICIQGKSVFCEELFKKGIITLEDLTTDGNDVITGFEIMAVVSKTRNGVTRNRVTGFFPICFFFVFFLLLFLNLFVRLPFLFFLSFSQ